VWWLDVSLALVAVFLGIAFYWVSKRLRLRIRVINRAREKLETEERRVFDFLHTIGEALSGDMRADDLNRIIVEGAVQITEASGGAIYLADRKGLGVRRGYGTPEHSTIFTLPAESTKSKDLMATFLRWHTVPVGEGIIGEIWSSGQPLLVNGDDPRLPRAMHASVMIAPLTFGGQKLGVLFVTRRAAASHSSPVRLVFFMPWRQQSASPSTPRQSFTKLLRKNDSMRIWRSPTKSSGFSFPTAPPT
jgi:sigma-B regulation protein RsbU (phosphoserine phosphatase)